MVIVEVTADDIARGRAKECESCPVARAVRRAFGSEAVWVDWVDEIAWIGVAGKTCIAPNRVAAFVASFDSGRKPKPFTFELPDLDAPVWVSEDHP